MVVVEMAVKVKVVVVVVAVFWGLKGWRYHDTA